MIETLLMKYNVYLPQESLHLLEYHANHVMSKITDKKPRLLEMALADLSKFLFDCLLTQDPGSHHRNAGNNAFSEGETSGELL
mmetsp:Transcript_14536/g.22580  ORF Transcript_14536/g.22580 Transcript_14536/m.22580 type:complete len:83 (+) Transcript_14536:945-1193(+)